MSRFNVMPRAYRRQLQATDLEHVQRITRTQADDLPTGSAGILRGIPVAAPGVPGVMRGSSPLGELMARQPHDD